MSCNQSISLCNDIGYSIVRYLSLVALPSPLPVNHERRLLHGWHKHIRVQRDRQKTTTTVKKTIYVIIDGLSWFLFYACPSVRICRLKYYLLRPLQPHHSSTRPSTRASLLQNSLPQVPPLRPLHSHYSSTRPSPLVSLLQNSLRQVLPLKPLHSHHYPT